ncbi:MAG TPA: nucleotidyltransferase domain-containing protein [Acidimicrobiia bacterium]|nr:nucleotidyltransferase domain-containing protein [Acidimicrobiia bacterium]
MARSIAVIGSVARGEATSSSDIDFLVEFEPSSSQLDLIRLEAALSQLLGVDVDVISRGALLDRDEGIRREATDVLEVSPCHDRLTRSSAKPRSSQHGLRSTIRTPTTY